MTRPLVPWLPPIQLMVPLELTAVTMATWAAESEDAL